VPEGDTIHAAARRVGAALVGKEIVAIETPQPRHAMDRWPDRLAGREVQRVDAHGKHLFLRFAGDLTLHSHLRMGGLWGVYGEGRRWSRSRRRAWLVLRTPDHEVVQFDGPVLELMTDSRTRFDRRIAQLGPDVLGEELDVDEVVRRLRGDDPTRPIGDALLDQRTIAGIGNLWKCEGCHAAAVDPWRPAGEVADDQVREIVAWVRPQMQHSALHGFAARPRAVFELTGRPCPRCGAKIEQRGQWDDNRPTYWCPGCQA